MVRWVWRSCWSVRMSCAGTLTPAAVRSATSSVTSPGYYPFVLEGEDVYLDRVSNVVSMILEVGNKTPLWCFGFLY